MSRRWLLLILAIGALFVSACSSGGGSGGGDSASPDKGAPIPTGQTGSKTGSAKITFDLQARQARISDTAVNILINILDPVTQVPLAQPVTVPVDRTGATQTVTITVPVGDVLLLVETLDASGNVLDVGSGLVTVTENTTSSVSITLRPFDQTVVGIPSELVFVGQPNSAGQNDPLGTVQVAVQDGNGLLIASATDAITVAIANNPSGGILGGTVTVNAVNGIATFSNLSINNPGTGYTLIAAATSRNSDISASFDIAAVPASLAVTVPPTQTAQLAAITPAVQVSILDQNGVVVPDATNTVTVSLATGTGTLSGTLTVNAVNGVATFSDLSIDQVGTGFSLQFNSTGLKTVTSSSFDTTNAAGVPTQVAFVVQPVDTNINQTITPPVQVVIQDFQGTTVSTATNDVTLTLSTNPGGANLNGTLTVTAVNGVAVFNNLNLDAAGTGYQLTAASAGLTSAVSSTFNILAVVGPPVAFFGQQNFPHIATSGDRRFAAPILAVAADFNTDGRMDFVGGDGINTGSPCVYLNTMAAGTLIPTFSGFGIPSANSGSFNIVVADVNTDGRPDIIDNQGNPSPTQQFEVLLNTTASGAATPSFGPPSSFNSNIPGSGHNGYNGFEFGDINQDGLPDIILGFGFNQGFSVCLNTTTSGSNVATFSAPTDLYQGQCEGSPTLKDIDGDGRLDAVLAGNGNLFVSLNTTPANAATPSFATPVAFAPSSGNVADVVCADFDGDTKPDVASGDQVGNRVRVWRNLTPLGGPPAMTESLTIATGFGTRIVQVGDFNNDGRADLACTNYNTNALTPHNQNSVSVMINSALPGVIAFQPRADFPVCKNGFGFDVADFNNDGILDLCVGSGDVFGAMTTVLMGTTPNGATTASFSTGNFLQSGNGCSDVEHADFNTDGSEDLIVSNHTDGTSTVYLNNGTGTFSATPFAAGTQPLAVYVADLNTDGLPDGIVVNNVSNDLTTMLNTTASGAGTPSFTLGSTPVGAQPTKAAVGDFNRDGRPDLAVLLSGGNFTRVLLNTTTSGAATATFAAPFDIATTNPTDVLSADYDGDGSPDLAVVANGAILIFPNTTPIGGATASFGAQFQVANFQGPRIMSADFNGDGIPDLANPFAIWFNTTTGGTLSFAINGIPSSGGQYQTFSNIFLLGTDVSGDGLPDLLIGDEPNSDFAFVRNTTAIGSTTASLDQPLYFLAGDWQNRPTNAVFGGATAADFTGDGKVDIAVASPGTSSLNQSVFGSVVILPQQ